MLFASKYIQDSRGKDKISTYTKKYKKYSFKYVLSMDFFTQVLAKILRFPCRIAFLFQIHSQG